MHWTFADAFREEDEQLRRRFVHATRPPSPMSLTEAAALCARMAGEPLPDLEATDAPI